MQNDVYRFLLYLTNNLEKSMHEKEWDMVIFILMTLSILIALPLLIFQSNEYGWACAMFIWYLQAIDQIRFNREKRVVPKVRKVEDTQRYPKDEL